MSGYGWVGAGQALREFGNAVQGYYGQRQDRQEREREEARRQQALDDEKQYRAAQLALGEQELGLSREAGQRAERGLQMQEVADLERQVGRAAGQQAAPSLVAQADKLGVKDRLFASTTDAQTMLPGYAPESSPLPTEMLLGTPATYNRDMRTPQEVQTHEMRAAAHADDLLSSAQNRATQAALAKYYGRLPQTATNSAADDNRILLNNMEQALGRYESQATQRRQRIAAGLLSSPLWKIRADSPEFQTKIDEEYNRLYHADEQRAAELAFQADELRKMLLPKDFPVWPGLFEPDPNASQPPPEQAAVGAALNTSPTRPRAGSLRR
jgi:hypothetical protein